jgi:hypothetical protein
MGRFFHLGAKSMIPKNAYVMINNVRRDRHSGMSLGDYCKRNKERDKRIATTPTAKGMGFLAHLS